MEIKVDKGKKHGSCNVTACQKLNAKYFNKLLKPIIAKLVQNKLIG